MKKLIRLKPRVKLLTDFFVWDTETGVDVQYSDLQTREVKTGIQFLLRARPENFKFGCIYGKNYNATFHDRAEMVQEFLTPRFKNKKVFAHNVGNFDGSVLFGNLCITFPTAVFNGSRFICASNGNGGKFAFADSINIFVGQSIEKIGKQLGISKPVLGEGDTKKYLENLYSQPKELQSELLKNIPVDYWAPNGITAEEINRCHQDCVILYEALVRTFEFAGDIKITRASLAMTLFRRKFQLYDIEHNENTAYFWDSYYGGRTEAFFIGKTNASVYDVVSMYADQMRNLKFPNPKYLKEVTHVKTDVFIKRYLPHYEGCVYAEVYHHKIWCGLLPVKHNGKLLFPTGHLSGCWNFNELKFAIETGHVQIKSISKIIYAERMLSPFIDYVDGLFFVKNKAEIDGDDFLRDEAKRMLTNLYGKFAQRIDEETIYIENIEKQYEQIYQAQKKGSFKKLIMFNSKRVDAFLVVGTSRNISINYSIPSFASYITSGARIKIAKKLLECEKNKVVYCDTDSVFVENDFGMISEKFLGGWGKEEKIVTEIRGLKNYKFIAPDKKNPAIMKKYRKLKGVPDTAKEKTPDNFQYFNLIKTKEALRRGLEAGISTERKKKIKGTYDKRIVFKNGETEPIHI